jgi:hypothetical protein
VKCGEIKISKEKKKEKKIANGIEKIVISSLLF